MLFSLFQGLLLSLFLVSSSIDSFLFLFKRIIGTAIAAATTAHVPITIRVKNRSLAVIKFSNLLPSVDLGISKFSSEAFVKTIFT